MDKFVMENTSAVNDFEYKKENNDGKYIAIKTAKGEYDVRNRKDLMNFGLESAYVSFDLLEQYCKLFNEPQFEIRFLLNDRDIKLTSDKINFTVYKTDRLDIAAEDRAVKYGATTKHIKERKTSGYKSDISINKDINIDNTIILNLRLNEIIATFLNISHAGDRIDYPFSKNFLNKHLSEFEKIGLLVKEKSGDKEPVYIVTDGCINMARRLKLLVNVTPNVDLFMNKKIMTKKNIKFLFSYIKKDFIEVLNRFDDFRFLLRLIDELYNLGKYTMMDIVKYCIENKYESEFIKIFIGSKGTAGRGAIIEGKDICYDNLGTVDAYNSNCNICYAKHNIDLNNGAYKLLHVRDNVVSKKYKEIVTDNDLGILVDDPLTLKFLVRFGVTYYNKNILKALDVINSKVYMKSTGKYCPYRDEWRANKNEI